MEDSGTAGELDDINLDDSPWVDIDSQGEFIKENTEKSFKIVRRRSHKLVPNYKAAKIAHESKKYKVLQCMNK